MFFKKTETKNKKSLKHFFLTHPHGHQNMYGMYMDTYTYISNMYVYVYAFARRTPREMFWAPKTVNLEYAQYVCIYMCILLYDHHASGLSM